MQYFKLLKTQDSRVYLLDNLTQGSPEWSLSSGMAYLESGIASEIILLDEKNTPQLKVKLPEAFTQIKTTALELNTELQILEILKNDKQISEG